MYVAGKNEGKMVYERMDFEEKPWWYAGRLCSPAVVFYAV